MSLRSGDDVGAGGLIATGHVGSEDWRSIPASVQAFGALTGIPVTVVPDGGHNLPKAYVGALLNRWLMR
jgi:hypothetical protein